MNLPNKITLSRIVLLPFIIFFYLSASFFSYGKLVSCILFVIACLTDFLDGYVARKYNLVTTLGKFLDAIADKIVVISALILIVADGTILAPFGVLALIVVIIREFVVSALRQICASKNVIFGADMWGKIKANFQFFVVIFFMLYGFLKDNFVLSGTIDTLFLVVCYTLLAIMVLSTISSGIHYLVKTKGNLSDKTQD